MRPANEPQHKHSQKLLEEAHLDPDILAAFLFGSKARGEATSGSDTDICFVVRPGRDESTTMAAKFLRFLSAPGPDSDISFFHDLPLYIQTRVLAEGQLLFCHDEDLLYDLAADTVRRFERYRRHYESYLRGLRDAR